MNKRQKLITSFLLIITMAVSGSYAFAGTEGQSSDEGEQAVIGVTDEIPADEMLTDDASDIEEPLQDMMIMNEPGTSQENEEEEATFNARSVLDNGLMATTVDFDTTQVPGVRKYNYSGNDNCFIKVKASTSGRLWVYAKCSTSAELYVGKYDPNTGAAVGFTSRWMEAGKQVSAIGGPDVEPSGTYFIKIYAAKSGSIEVLPYVYSYATRTLPEGKVMYTEGYKTSSNGSMTDSNAMFLIKPAKTGYITVSAAEYGYNSSAGFVTLLNASKKAVSDRLYFNDKSQTDYVVFGVQKGVTYYLQASGFQGTSENQYVYAIQYKNYEGALRANTSKKKATKLKRKANYITAVMPATGNAGKQWYKFKVKKKRTTKIAIDATYVKSGNMTITVYCGKKKIGSTTLTKGRVTTLSVTNSNRIGKAKKGTYYVKVSKSASTNGQYRIRYLK